MTVHVSSVAQQISMERHPQDGYCQPKLPTRIANRQYAGKYWVVKILAVSLLPSM